ncbi:putative PIG3 family NAD(P)H quinone oxidoreductase [Methylopila capsulata]|uniref:NAD(P)H quinone oxidoreductase n=1 Tax=Methylopila capsulata TaxID=61654 RepID=A0A9W6MRH8_9HYPH|nr:NAD(P)H-quinone oxidoreductase [Methylopila capsulata]MBM7851951.1 putative PIG3 family NAD(P)H quinone oxidoreductase [Methylopila capsulata]GLK55016.1 NAD(P)H quinone oxidoreductase [Methylopila capsulata]
MTDLPTEMAYVRADGAGEPDVLGLAHGPLPEPGEGEVLVEVVAAGVNRPDVMQRKGMYPPPPGAPETLGLEIAGRIVKLGAGVTNWAIGDAVCALIAGGGYAEYAVAPAATCLAAPKGLTLVEAAAAPETFFTVWTNVFEQAGLKSGQRFLVHGGTSGIGTTAIQLAKARGATAYATAGGADKVAFCEKLGAAKAIDYRTEDFVEVLKAETGGKGVDVILDMVGGDYTARNLKSLAFGGTLVQIAFMQGPKVQIDLTPIMLKRLTLTGSTLRARPIAQKAAIAEALQREVWPLIESGEVKPVIHATFPLAEAAEAHRLMEGSSHMGKIMLTTGKA